jgi:biotin carboxyl carrier protein
MKTYEYQVQVGGGKEPRQVVVEPLGDERFRVVVDGQEAVLAARRVESSGSAATWSLIDAAGRQRVVDVDGAAGELKVTVSAGEPIALKIADLRDGTASSSAGGGAAASELRAAMPGKVVKISCKVGDQVKAGQALLVIEAMKMENELRSPGAGKVAEVAVREGQTVEGGQLLVGLTPQG